VLTLLPEPAAMSDTADETLLPAVDQRAALVAAHTGAAPSGIERLPFDLSALEDGGAFVNVDASGFGLLDRRLDWRTLGIELPRQADFAFRPPRHGLLPDHYRLPLLRPADRAHSALHRFSYRFQLVETVLESTAYRWVPWQAWPEFERSFQAEQQRLTAALEAYESHHGLIREQALAAFGRLAADSACRLAATGQTVPAGFEDAIVHEVLNALPDPDQLRERLLLRYRIGVFHLGSELLAEQRLAAEERRRLEMVEADRDLQAAERRAQEHLVQEQLWTEQERLRVRLRAEQEEQRQEAAVKERLRQLKLEAARERLQDTLSPLEEGARQLHATVFEATMTLRESLRKNHALRGSSARKVRDLSKWFAAMNWTDDRQLEALIGELQGLADRPASHKRKRDPEPIDSVLTDIIQLTHDRARTLLEPSRFDALEL
jgi:hypothetical protein